MWKSSTSLHSQSHRLIPCGRQRLHFVIGLIDVFHEIMISRNNKWSLLGRGAVFLFRLVLLLFALLLTAFSSIQEAKKKKKEVFKYGYYFDFDLLYIQGESKG